MKLEKFLMELKPESLNEIVAGARDAGGGSGGGGTTNKNSSSKTSKTTGKKSGKHKTKKIHVCGCP